MDVKEAVRVEEIHGREVDEFLKANQRLYSHGIIKIWPSGCTLFTEYQNHVERIRRFKVKPDDVWIVTYPKCGES